MNQIIKLMKYAGATLLALCLFSCSDEEIIKKTEDGKGTLLNLYAGMEVNTRLAEIGDADHMNDLVKGKQNIGLYIYYEDDYKADDLSKPYIRNLQCKIVNGKLVPTDPAYKDIYIYDRMTIIAFYPYNANAKDFAKKDDEKAYPITESDYEQQLYIPYRAETKVNPTNAYLAKIGFGPQQTCKVEVVLVADDISDFPASVDTKDGTLKMLPNIDPYTPTYVTGVDRRETWLDGIENFPKTGDVPVGGKYVRRYTTYVWKSGNNKNDHHDGYTHDNNKLEKGDILFESDELTLMIPHELDLAEETVYRYGYDMNTGKIFIPTADKLVYDATSLKELEFSKEHVYQVCDIDLNTISWTPKTTNSGVYDGGGHAIKNLKIDTKPIANVDTENKIASKQSFGLFGSISGTSTLTNIYLVDPKITIDYTESSLIDTCFVGTICGLINPELSEKEKIKIIEDGLPKELSKPVKDALIKEQLQDFANTTCYVRGCKVENPVITITGKNVYAGALCGGVGNQNQKAEIKDSYVSATNDVAAININDSKKGFTNIYAGSFAGLLGNGSISNCYTTLSNVKAYQTQGTATTNVAAEFCRIPAKTAVTIKDCYTTMDHINGVPAQNGVTNFKTGWPTAWPLFGDNSDHVSNGLNLWPTYTWDNSWKDMGTKPSKYPILIWEFDFIVENK